MFNGIIFYIGILSEIIKSNNSTFCFVFKTSYEFCSLLKIGRSVSCSGVCLTVVKIEGDLFFVYVSKVTLEISKFVFAKENDIFNLELPIKYGDFVDGHILQGHVDATAKIINIKPDNGSYIMTIEIPFDISSLVVQKGSIAIDGISLTIVDVDYSSLKINVVPYTYENTTLRKLKIGDCVNIETDILGRYIKRYIEISKIK